MVCYGVQIMPHFKFADEWQGLGASTTLTGRILSKYGLIESIEQYFNPDRETRWEWPLLDNIIVGTEADEHYTDPQNQMLRAAVISDTDSVTGDALITTDRFGKISFEDLEKHADRIEKKDKKSFYFFDTPLQVTNYIDGGVQYDDVEFMYSHDCEKDIYEIELEDGSKIKITGDHSILVCNSSGEPVIEKKPFELTTDDICVVCC